jgi:hypothetical protein
MVVRPSVQRIERVQLADQLVKSLFGIGLRPTRTVRLLPFCDFLRENLSRVVAPLFRRPKQRFGF